MTMVDEGDEEEVKVQGTGVMGDIREEMEEDSGGMEGRISVILSYPHTYQ